MLKNAKEINCEEIPGFSSQLLAVHVFLIITLLVYKVPQV